MSRDPLPLAHLRQSEFSRLDRTGTAYLDYTGAALYPESLVMADARRLSNGVFGNPHSESRVSRLSTEALDEARARTLALLDADPREYQVVFTANASNAIKILAEGFAFRRGSRLVMSADNHNSVNGLRLAARRRGAGVHYVGLDAALRSLDPSRQLLPVECPSLFAFPAQSNFSGIRHPLSWVRLAHRRGYRVLLDAASFLGSHRLSLRHDPADFVALSFYKIFGYPTGVGALVARVDALAELRRNYFAGGAVQFVSVQNRVSRRKRGAEGFEDGTPSFLAMPAVVDALRWTESLGAPNIEKHVSSLTVALLDRLHSLGDRAVVYGGADPRSRGATVAFNVVRGDQLLPYEAIEAAAHEAGLAVRGGCFCNPGAAEHAFGHSPAASRGCLRGRFSIPRFRACLGGTPVGAVRASLGIANTLADLDRLLICLRQAAGVSRPLATTSRGSSARNLQP